MKEVKLNPINEDDLEDKRNVISENCFTELDIAAKAWQVTFGEDNVYEEISLLRSTFAYLLGNHKNEHGLSNVDIDKFSIPESPFKNDEDVWVDKLYDLKTEDSLHYIMNILMNSREGFMELTKSEYFKDIKPDLILDSNALLYNVGMSYDRSILQINNKYSILILNLK
tara:strand:+ start:596 stop:1102 length:507 start_codon:yes stop_codon:yes gene_type:complete